MIIFLRRYRLNDIYISLINIVLDQRSTIFSLFVFFEACSTMTEASTMGGTIVPVTFQLSEEKTKITLGEKKICITC